MPNSKPSIFTSILNPHSIAVVGASRHPHKVGYQLLKNIITSRYHGKVYPVNPNAKSILGLKAYPTLSNLPQPPELTVVVTPPPLVLPVIEEAVRLQLRAAVIITAGFAESGDKGKHLQAELSRLISGSSLRLLGPNCLGILSHYPPLNATFGPPLPQKGHLTLVSQSGAMVTGILDWAAAHHLGLAHAITLGNRLDISETEALEFAAADPHTQLILFYLESFAQPQAFFSLASKVTPHKPIILLKGGQSVAGQKASSSHTAALATDYALTQSFGRQTGVTLVNNLHQFLNLAALFSSAPPVSGPELAIITNAGGPGVVSTDEAIAAGLNIVPVTPKTGRHLHLVLNLPQPQNPIDILGDALPQDFITALNLVDQDTVQDAIMVIITPQTPTKPLRTAQAIVSFAKTARKPIFVILIGGNKLKAAKTVLARAQIPVFDYPQEAINLISKRVDYYYHQQNPSPYPASHHSPLSATQKNKLLAQLSKPLTLKNAFKLLKSYQFPIPESKIVDSYTSLHQAVKQIGPPVILKTASMSLLHKKQSGGVYPHIMNPLQARLAYSKLIRFHPQVLVQKMVLAEGELIIGAKRDPHFGPFVTVGLGGSFTDSLGDRSFAFIPTNKKYLKTALSLTQAFKLIKDRPLLVDAVVSSLASLASILLDFEEISELEINPLLFSNHSVYAADIKIQLKAD